MNKKLLLVLMCLLAFGAYKHHQHRPVIHGVGEIAPDEPLQTVRAPQTFSLTASHSRRWLSIQLKQECYQQKTISWVQRRSCLPLI